MRQKLLLRRHSSSYRNKRSSSWLGPLMISNNPSLLRSRWGKYSQRRSQLWSSRGMTSKERRVSSLYRSKQQKETSKQHKKKPKMLNKISRKLRKTLRKLSPIWRRNLKVMLRRWQLRPSVIKVKVRMRGRRLLRYRHKLNKRRRNPNSSRRRLMN